MRKYKILLVIILTACLNNSSYSQCPIDAGQDQTITCGLSVQLNAQQIWQSQNSGTSESLRSVHFPTQDTGYVVGIAGTILRTYNGGDTWTSVSVSGVTGVLNTVFFTSSTTGYISGNNGLILKTNNAGQQWNILTSGTSEDLNDLFFTNTNTGYAIGNNGIILKTINGGTSWTLQNSGVSWHFQSCWFTDSDTGYVSGGSGSGSGILKTTNGGQQWEIKANLASMNNSCLFFLSADTGYMAATFGISVLLKTTDGFNTWSFTNSPWLQSIHFTSADTGFAAGGTPYFTSDSGQTWTPMISQTAVKDIFMLSANKGFAVGFDGSIPWTGVITKYSSDFTSYSWQPSTALNNPNIMNPVANPIVTTTYYLTASEQGNTCTSIDSVTIFVNPLTVIAPVDNYLIPTGGSASIDSIITNYTGVDSLSVVWSPNIALNNPNLYNPIANPCFPEHYQVSVTTSNGCNAVDSVYISVWPGTIMGTSENFICGDSVQLGFATNNINTTNATYLWQPSTGLTDTTIVNPVATVDTTQIYSVTLTTFNGCSVIGSASAILQPMPAPPICIVSVDTNNRNVIVWETPQDPFLIWNLATIDSFYVYRETNITNVYQKIGVIDADSQFVFVDSTAQPSMQSYKYALTLKDHCGYESNRSTPHKTMHLSINQGMGNTWNLIWQAYEGFTVSTYNIYRSTDGINFDLIGTMSGSNTQFNDFNAPAGFVYYQVEVIIGVGCNPDKVFNSSRSNIATNNPTDIQTYGDNLIKLQVFPNPANDYLQILTEKVLTIQIYDITGKLLINTDTDNNNTVNISFLQPGIYYIIDPHSNQKGRFIKY